MFNPQSGNFSIPQNPSGVLAAYNSTQVLDRSPAVIQLNKAGLVSIIRRDRIRQYANTTTWSQIRVMQVMTDLIKCGWSVFKTKDGWMVASSRRKRGAK